MPLGLKTTDRGIKKSTKRYNIPMVLNTYFWYSFDQWWDYLKNQAESGEGSSQLGVSRDKRFSILYFGLHFQF